MSSSSLKIEDLISDKTMQLIYNSAKIIANPYDYKLSDRVFCYKTDVIGDDFNIFEKTCDTEAALLDALGMDFDRSNEYMNLNPNLGLGSYIPDNTYGDFSDQCRELDINVGTSGALVKYNNLRIDEPTLLNDLAYMYRIPDPTVNKSLILSLQYDNYLKALEVLLEKTISSGTLIPNLMYLTTEYSDYRLVDLEDITFAVNAIEHNIPALCPNRYGLESTDALESSALLCTINVPFYQKSFTSPFKYTSKEDYILFKRKTEHANLGNAVYKLGICYTCIYGAELLYQLDSIKDADVVTALEKLFAVNYRDGSFCSKYVYSINTEGHIEINPAIKACFSDNPELRFKSIHLYFEHLLTLPDLKDDILSHYDYYIIPVFFARMVMSMHNFAFQTARIKHATLIYTKAKDAGLLNKAEVNERIKEAMGDGELIGDGTVTAGDEHNTELMNLDMLDLEYKDSRSFEEKEKEIVPHTESTPPMLTAMDRLKKDLNDSDYDFDIDFVKHDSSYQASYNVIANKISLITHDLIRQIKEIKTYNTGGKQGGLLTGKLDKKNLWKYKNDPHIFYNNNYKLKEMDLAFGCILDESGSMSGDKIKNGRIVMIMLHEVLSALGINHSIIGHTSRCDYQSKIFKYFQFKEESHYTLNKPYGLVRAEARSGNCDSGALFYMQSCMKAVRNKDKIVIIFSDGEPTECTDDDLIKQVKHMEKNGIHVIGVGINFPSIKEYYPDNANGKNLKEMVDIVVSILKRYVLEKKED